MDFNRISSFYILSKISGICPLTTKNLSKKQNMSEYFDYIPTIFLLVLYIICLTSVFYKNDNKSEITVTANLIQFIPNSLAYLLALTYALNKRQMLKNILIKIQQCDEKLQNYFLISFNGINNQMFSRSILTCLSAIILNIVFASINFSLTVNVNELRSVLYWFGFCLPKFTLLLVNLQFGGLIRILIDRIDLIQSAMNVHLNEATNQIELTTGNSKIELMKSKTMLTNIKTRLPSLKDSLQGLTEIFEILQDIAEKINIYFGKQMVLMLLSAFICVTVQLYHLINIFRLLLNSYYINLIGICTINIILIHVIEFWIVYGSGSLIKDKWTSMISLLLYYKLKVTDKDVKENINDLTKWMINRRIEFVAVGYFPIDLTIGTGIVSAIATYLIVLLQFKLSEDQMYGKNSSISALINVFSAYSSFGPINAKE